MDDDSAPVLRVLVDALPDMFAYWDADLRCRFANRAYHAWFGVGHEAMIGIDMRTLLGPLFELNRPHIEGALAGERQAFERTIPDPAGGPPRHSHAQYIPDVVDGRVRGFCALVVDMTRRVRAEESLRQRERAVQTSARLASTATLVSGIAHEINNPLASVVASLDLALSLLDRRDDSSTLAPLLREARAGADRIAASARAMKTLARGNLVTRGPVNVDDALRESLDIAASVVRYRATVTRDLRSYARVDANAAQLTQVFLDLVVHAADGLPEERGERNEIRVSAYAEGERVVVEIASNGRGMTPEMQAQLFEPLTHGKISVRDLDGRGSVVRVELPAIEVPSHEEQSAPRLIAPPRSAASHQRYRVLVVDDEPTLRRLIHTALARDFDVTSLGGGAEAIRALCDEDAEYDVVLCDLMMPLVSGVQVYEAVRMRRPHLLDRFVFMTGGAFTPRGQEFLDLVQAPVLAKPFDVAVLRGAVTACAARARA